MITLLNSAFVAVAVVVAGVVVAVAAVSKSFLVSFSPQVVDKKRFQVLFHKVPKQSANFAAELLRRSPTVQNHERGIKFQ